MIPATGGEPKRLTYTATLGRDEVSDRMGPNNIVMGWTPGRQEYPLPLADAVVQRLHRATLHRARPRAGCRKNCRCRAAALPAIRPTVSKLVYNRVFREFRTWKRYRGGMCDDVWLYDFATKKTEQLTDDAAQDIIPMWVGGKIYFLSDRGPEQRFNLYSVDPTTKKVERHTDFTEFDIKFPSASDKRDRLRERRLHLSLRREDAARPRRCRCRFWKTASAPAVP